MKLRGSHNDRSNRGLFPRVMSCIIRVLLPIALLLITALSLLAPILEENSTPKPKRDVTPRFKPKPQANPKPKPNPDRSFAGTWGGSVIATASNGSESSSVTYVIRISDDEKTVWINWSQSGQPVSGPGYQAPCNRFRETLTWSFTFPENTSTDTLRITTDGTASFVREGKWTSGDNEGITYSQTGTLSRQSVSSPSSALTTIPSSAQKAGPSLNTSGNGFVALSPSGSMSGPRPESPPEARAKHLSGQGVFLLHFDKPTGNIIDVTVRQSTGWAILDQAAIATLRQWHATPGCPREVPMTITYSSSQ
jgi:TonB family protein